MVEEKTELDSRTGVVSVLRPLEPQRPVERPDCLRRSEPVLLVFWPGPLEWHGLTAPVAVGPLQ